MRPGILNWLLTSLCSTHLSPVPDLSFVFFFRFVRAANPTCLVLYTPRAGRTLPAGEGGCAAGSLPPSHRPK
jgi:hypothetical protein